MKKKKINKVLFHVDELCDIDESSLWIKRKKTKLKKRSKEIFKKILKNIFQINLIY